MMGEIARNMSSQKNTNKVTLLHLVGFLLIIGIIHNDVQKTIEITPEARTLTYPLHLPTGSRGLQPVNADTVKRYNITEEV
jgi:hypothetical protein